MRWGAGLFEALEPFEDEACQGLVSEMEEEAQAAAALWAWRLVLGIGLRDFRRVASEGVSGGLEGAFSAAIGEDSEVPDAVQAVGQGVKQEAPDELGGREAHGAVAGLLAGFACRLSVSELDGFAVEGEDAAVADGDPVGVSGEISDQGVGSGEGLPGVDHPLDLAGLVEALLEGAGALEAGAGAVAGDGSVADGLFGLLEEASAEVSREHLDGSEECAAADPPLAGVAVEACIRDDAVQVRMELEALVPGMEDGGAADADAEAPGVGGDGGEGLGGGAEQDREQDAPGSGRRSGRWAAAG